MDIEISSDFVDAVAASVAEKLRPMLARLAIPAPGNDDLLSVEGLTDYLGVSKDWVYQRTARNEIPFVKVGHLVKFRRADIDRWIAGQAVPAVSSFSGSMTPRLTGRARD